jgi:hypothetical protein
MSTFMPAEQTWTKHHSLARWTLGLGLARPDWAKAGFATVRGADV